jgi:proteasome accessory factor C
MPLEDLMAKLECSKSTLHRTINALKDYLNAPVIFDTDADRYRYAKETQGETYELPGMWFTPGELQALAVTQRLLKDVGGGLLDETWARRQAVFDSLRSVRGPRARHSMRLLRPRSSEEKSGSSTTHAVTTNDRSERFRHSESLTIAKRGISTPGDEARNALRSFSIDQVLRAPALDERAFDVPEEELDEHFASAYGIFGGKADKMATLHFTPERARWVADEKWHPQQEGKWLPDGRYELRIPYQNSRELVMDIVRHGPNVEVVTPEDLRKDVEEQLRRASEQYK